MMRYFKRPLIVTGICFVVALLITIASVIWIHNADLSNAEKAELAKKLGMIVGIGASIVPAPFWILAASRFGKDQREAQERAAAQSAGNGAQGDEE